MESATQIQKLDEAVCIILHINILGEGMYPLSFQIHKKIVEKTGLISFNRRPS